MICPFLHAGVPCPSWKVLPRSAHMRYFSTNAEMACHVCPSFCAVVRNSPVAWVSLARHVSSFFRHGTRVFGVEACHATRFRSVCSCIPCIVPSKWHVSFSYAVGTSMCLFHYWCSQQAIPFLKACYVSTSLISGMKRGERSPGLPCSQATLEAEAF